jgi:hypothetical protein
VTLVLPALPAEVVTSYFFTGRWLKVADYQQLDQMFSVVKDSSGMSTLGEG